MPFLEQIKLGLLAVHNWDDNAGHTFGLRVKRDGRLVHESTLDVEKMEGDFASGTVADCTWDDVSGEYVVAVRVDSDEWREFNLLEATDGSPECIATYIQYGTYWGIDENDPLNLKVLDWCDYGSISGGCQAYKSNSIR